MGATLILRSQEKVEGEDDGGSSTGDEGRFILPFISIRLESNVGSL